MLACDEQIQDERLLMRRDTDAYLFSQFTKFLLQHNNTLFSFVSELMDLLLNGEDQSAKQSGRSPL
jgi:hypothetical protein